MTREGPVSARAERAETSAESRANELAPGESIGSAGAASPDDRALTLPHEVAAVIERGATEWPAFLRRYSPFILGCIHRFARDYDERMDIYVHVCSRLRADDCRRIRQYRGKGIGGRCKFSTWLGAVTFNLAREWIRSARGRRRMFRAVRDLDRTDRLIFRYYFWERFSVSEIAQSLRSKHHVTLSPVEVMERLATIEGRLSSDHRWRLVTGLLRSLPPISIDRPRQLVREEARLELADVRANPEKKVRRTSAQAALRLLIDELPEQEKRALRLKFCRGMPAHAIAEALGIRNYKRVYEIQARALARLASGLEERGIELSDFADAWQSLDILS